MGNDKKLKIGVLTSSRADYGIYLPLLKKFKNDRNITLQIIAFGTHCNEYFGNTYKDIEKDGFVIYEKIENLLLGDSPKTISLSYANTVVLFSDFWEENADYDWVICLGDRFEMAAAVNAGIAFNISFAHIHAGETTLGAIDNIYRHQISLASKMQFVALRQHRERIKKLLGTDVNCHIVGALGLENIHEISLLSIEEFKIKWKIDLSIPTVLVTVHPETIAFLLNEEYAGIIEKALQKLLDTYQIVITMPNADTYGSLYRNKFEQLQKAAPKSVFLIENFGTQSYFTAMKYSSFLLGNTSSGIIEAASFQKMVINIGDRQKGRDAGHNVFHVPFEANKIIEAVATIKDLEYKSPNIYYRNSPSKNIIKKLKAFYS